jgi:NAD(P)-dependent dehydrogenase (short-subunit alcohol dehydrogenase family)
MCALQPFARYENMRVRPRRNEVGNVTPAVPTRRFQDRVALVTGGASGIGEATAARLASEGAAVVIADIDTDAGERTAAKYDGVSFIQTDVSDSASVQHLIERIVEDYGKVDAVHANAGIETPFLLLAETPDEWFDRAIAINTRGVFLVCKHVINHMLQRRAGGAIVCTSSLHDVATYPKIGVYAISKAAVGAIVRAISVEYATHGIRANAILPGATWTPMVKREIQDADDPVTQKGVIEGLQTMKRCAAPSELAAAVAFLLSDDASFMTGASVAVDGGALSGLPGPDVLTSEELGQYWREHAPAGSGQR